MPPWPPNFCKTYSKGREIGEEASRKEHWIKVSMKEGCGPAKKYKNKFLDYSVP
jgi:hypothetical protein